MTARSRLTVPLRVALGDGQPKGSKERACGREQHLGVAQHAKTRAGQLAGRLRDRYGREREQPSAAQRTRTPDGRSQGGGDAKRHKRQRHQRWGHQAARSDRARARSFAGNAKIVSAPTSRTCCTVSSPKGMRTSPANAKSGIRKK